MTPSETSSQPAPTDPEGGLARPGGSPVTTGEPTWCGLCGRALADGGHDRCARMLELEPPRYCSRCRRRMTVQVVPRGWSATCVKHGTVTS